MKKEIKIYFTDFWKTFKIEDNFFYNLLKEHYNIVISRDKPDYLFFSVFGNKFEEYNCTRIMFTGENVKPDLSKCDYAFCFSLPKGNNRIYRLPQYYQYGDMSKLTEKPNYDEILVKKTKFCNFIYSNPSCKKRNEFFKKLSKYKKVDSAGKFLNNIGSYLPEGHLAKREFLSPYKFTIAFENEECPFYTSEKIFEAMYVNSLPIYWGNPLIHLDFDSRSFLNWYDYGNDEALIERIIELDKDDQKYMEMLQEPYFHNNTINDYVDVGNLLLQFELIFNNHIEPVSLQSPAFSGNTLNKKSYLFKARLKYKFREYAQKVKRLSYQRVKMKIKRELNS